MISSILKTCDYNTEPNETLSTAEPSELPTADGTSESTSTSVYVASSPGSDTNSSGGGGVVGGAVGGVIAAILLLLVVGAVIIALAVFVIKRRKRVDNNTISNAIYDGKNYYH